MRFKSTSTLALPPLSHHVGMVFRALGESHSFQASDKRYFHALDAILSGGDYHHLTGFVTSNIDGPIYGRVDLAVVREFQAEPINCALPQRPDFYTIRLLDDYRERKTQGTQNEARYFGMYAIVPTRLLPRDELVEFRILDRGAYVRYYCPARLHVLIGERGESVQAIIQQVIEEDDHV
jgi:hypothetical protein